MASLSGLLEEASSRPVMAGGTPSSCSKRSKASWLFSAQVDGSRAWNSTRSGRYRWTTAQRARPLWKLYVMSETATQS